VDESTLRAPFSGTVIAVHKQPGEWANPGASVVVISGGSDLEVELQVPQSIITLLNTDISVIAELPFADATTTGRVSSGARAAAGPGSLFPVVVDLRPHPALVPGTAVEVLLEVAQSDALAVPLDAVLNPGSSTPSVFCVRDGRAEHVPVEVGRLDGDRALVVANLEIGEQVVVSGHTALADGDPVEVRR
jgi:RND family efflux transporter MFP subunit